MQKEKAQTSVLFPFHRIYSPTTFDKMLHEY